MCHTPIHELSEPTREIARDNHRFLLQRLADHGQNVVAEAVGISESKMSRIKDTAEGKGDLELFAVMCAVMDIKLVDAEAIYCEGEMIDIMSVMLSKAYGSPEFVRRMFSPRSELTRKDLVNAN
ncbi:CII family transcriptional regulator [Psychrobacter pygoscelis]|uniref:CII family transcriptional regulator n=1 Tax=Psychrobacter pygoscelis TaxID=2488563 RepID=UPI00103A186A|nr:CII family transcriptional regulator [Psychrobacter pygoscelis]